MSETEKKKYIIDILLIGIIYALIFTGLTIFVYPIELRKFRSLSDLIASALGAAFFFGAFSGFFTGFIASFWVNRQDFHSQIAIGLISGILAAIIGSIFFPFLGAFLRMNFFGTNPKDLFVEVSLLVNYSMIGVSSGSFTAAITGILGGMIFPSNI